MRNDTFKTATVHETTLCITFSALRFGPPFRVLARCLKYTTICMVSRTCVSQTTLCVAFGARRRSHPLRVLGHPLAIWAAKAAQEIWTGSGGLPFRLPRSPRGALWPLLPRTYGRVSAVGGGAMNMKWPDGIGWEAGIGRTRNGKELNVFRACP